LKRPNVIVVGLVLVSVAILGFEVYTVARRRAGRGTANVTAAAPDPTPETTPPPARRMRPMLPRPPGVPPLPSSVAPPGGPPLPSIVAPATLPPHLAAPRNGDATEASRGGQPSPSLYLAATADGARRNADEMMFASMQLDSDTRAAILRINDAFNAKLIALRNAAVVNGPDVAASDAAVQTRRDALRQLLGPETAARFETGEQVAFGRLQMRRR
jgi:hypothetical protein